MYRIWTDEEIESDMERRALGAKISRAEGEYLAYLEGLAIEEYLREVAEEISEYYAGA